MMPINWPMLGVWFSAALGVFVVGQILIQFPRREVFSSLPFLCVLILAAWVFSTGVVRSVTTWSVPLCWLVGLVLALPIYFVLGAVVVLFLFVIFGLPLWWKERQEKQNSF